MTARLRLLFSDLMRLWKQGIAIVVLLACGISTLIMSTTTIRSLEASRDHYYSHYRFAHLWASVVRAPDAILDRILDIPGVTRASGRIVRQAILDFPDSTEPITARLVSIETPRTSTNPSNTSDPELQPQTFHQELDDLYIRQGRLPLVGSSLTEAVVSELFAQAHQLKLGDTLHANLGGKQQKIEIVGIGLSPDSIYVVQPGLLLSDNRLYGILWIPRKSLEAAWNMEGAWNHLAVEIENESNRDKIQNQIDVLLAPYGGTGSIHRDDQESHARVRDELNELRTMALLAPTIFLSVTVFLIHMVFTRWITQQRERIATLRAFGYRTGEITWDVLQVVSLWIVAGVLLGSVIGLQLARWLSELYKAFFRFPEVFHLPLGWPWILAVSLGAIVATLGAWSGLRQIMKLPPALAMHPGTLPTSTSRWLARWTSVSKLSAAISPSLRLVLLRVLSNPWLTSFSVLGVAFGIALLILSSFFEATIDRVLEHQFSQSQHFDFQLTFDEPRSPSAIHEVSQWPGVQRVEAFRSVPVQLQHETSRERGALLGLDPDAQLFRLLDKNNIAYRTDTKHGLIITGKLAQKLQVQRGDHIDVQILEGEQRRISLTVEQVFENYTGPAAFIDRATLHELLREGDRASGVHLTINPEYQNQIYRKIKDSPYICGAINRQATLANFRDLLGKSTGWMRFINAVFAALIMLGVAYNSALITFSERARDLATLRVLGYRKNEVLWILLLELLVITLLAIPIGIPLGYTFAYAMITALDSDSHRLPLVIDPRTIAYTLSIVALATTLCCGLVARMATHLDIVSVLKVRE